LVHPCMLISVCGTPGTGKTTAARALGVSGHDVYSLHDLIGESGIHDGIDRSSGSILVDPFTLREYLEGWARRVDQPAILEGHLAYLAPSDICFVLRVSPDRLMERLMARGYTDAKSRENAEAEGVGTILSWALIEENRRLGDTKWEDLAPGKGIVFEKDVTDLSIDDTSDWLKEMMDAYQRKDLDVLKRNRPGMVDFLEVISAWY